MGEDIVFSSSKDEVCGVATRDTYYDDGSVNTVIKTKEDLTGQRFGRLTVICQTDDHVSKSGCIKAQWLCRCDCGNEVAVIGTNLKRGNSKSCGCLNDELRKTRSIKHGDRHTRLYRTWTNMKSRTCHTGTRSSVGYGDRGITMCDEWKNDYTAFREWALANGYNDTLSIDRIDVDGNYCPENCRWVDSTVQANNRRSSKYITVNGITKSMAQWADDLGYSRSIFNARAKLYGTTVEEQVKILATS